jgi:uncharacterized membrane protein
MLPIIAGLASCFFTILSIIPMVYMGINTTFLALLFLLCIIGAGYGVYLLDTEQKARWDRQARVTRQWREYLERTAIAEAEALADQRRNFYRTCL